MTREDFDRIMLEEGFESQRFRDKIWKRTFDPSTRDERFLEHSKIMESRFKKEEIPLMEEESLRQTCQVFKQGEWAKKYEAQYGHSLCPKSEDVWPDEIGG